MFYLVDANYEGSGDFKSNSLKSKTEYGSYDSEGFADAVEQFVANQPANSSKGNVNNYLLCLHLSNDSCTLYSRYEGINVITVEKCACE